MVLRIEGGLLMFEFEYEPRVDVYERLIKYALKTSDAFMFVICNYGGDSLFEERILPFIKELEPLLIKNRMNDPRWPGTEASEEIHRYKIHFYRSDPSALKTLLRPISLYNWQYPYFPEDLCFFRDGYCWFSTTAHEELSCIYVKDDQELNQLYDIGVTFKKYKYELLSSSNNDVTYKRKELKIEYEAPLFYEEY